MGRTIHPDSIPDRSTRSRGGGFRSSQPRSVLISKALSRLLRHQAENERVPITSDGWVRLDHLLAWRGLKVGGGSPVTVEEIWSVVEENEKKRFAVRLVKESKGEGSVEEGSTQQSDEKEAKELETETARAIASFRTSNPTPPASAFLVRATQGHSIRTIASDAGLLTPLTLSETSTIPTTCVHGTFYGSWPAILASGGLKRMGRNHVHFAQGPTLAELGLDEKGEKMVSQFEGDRTEVISGMRRDAQLLIYVDVKRALEDSKQMEWWRSENGVLLTAGVELNDAVLDAEAESSIKESMEVVHQRKGKQAQAAAQDDKMVPTKYWTVVIDVKGGREVVWRQGEGVVKELDETLVNRGTPKGRGRGRGRGGGR